jgi:hypothetical protein
LKFILCIYLRSFKSQKARFFLVGALLFAVAGLGYWIGFVHSSNSRLHSEALVNNIQQFKISQNNEEKLRLDNRLFDKFKLRPEHSSNDKPERNEPKDTVITGNDSDEKVHIVDTERLGKSNVKNKNAEEHVQDIHKAHALQINQIKQGLKTTTEKSKFSV